MDTTYETIVFSMVKNLPYIPRFPGLITQDALTRISTRLESKMTEQKEQELTQATVKIISKEGDVLEVSTRAAAISELLKAMLEGTNG